MDSMDSMMKVCSKDGCEKKYCAKGLCQRHYRQLPEVKLRRKEIDKKYESKPESKLKKKERRKRYSSKPESKVKRKKYDKKYESKPESKLKKKEYIQKHPEVNVKAQKKYFKKLSDELGLFPFKRIPMAFNSWAKTVRKILGDYCHVCGSTKQIEIHHIFHKVKYPLLSLNENNGIPLCKLCHYQTHGKLLIQPLQNFPS